MKSRPAFTLIELLVVIAIIAILAAILFPVFAQAKEAAKKTATLAQAKQYGTSLNIYTTDSDDVNPISYGTFRQFTDWDVITPFPAGWFNDGSWSTPGGVAEASTHWANSLAPYVKNGQLGEVTGAARAEAVTSDFGFPRLKEPYYIGLSMNGLMSTLSASSVVSPSSAPIFWTGFGKLNFGGRALTSPALECDAPAGGPCQFNPTGPAQAGAQGGIKADTWFWGSGTSGSPANFNPPAAAYGSNSTIIVRADTSAKVWPHIPAPNTTSRDPNAIFTSVDANGVPTVMKRCNLNGGSQPMYRAFFRPDYDGSGRQFFSNGGGQCDDGS